jgi:type IV secretory pathway VirB10-like protein
MVSWRWIQHLPVLAQHYPKTTAAVGAAAVLGGYLCFSPSEPVTVKAQHAQVKVAPSITTRTTVEGLLGETIQRLDASEKTNQELAKTLRMLQTDFREAKEERARDKETYEQRLAQEQKRREEDIARANRARQKESAAKVVTAHPVVNPPVVTAPPAAKQFELRVIGTPNKDTAAKRLPARLHQEDTAYLGEASVAPARMMTGILASGRGSPNPPGAEGDSPVLLSITGPFDSAWMLHGPGQNPEPTSVPVQGCRMFGWARADLAKGRVDIHLYLLVCVMPDKSTYPVRIRGYVADKDGSAGLVGRLETRDSAMVAKAILTGLIQETASLIGLAKSSVVVTSNAGGYQQPFTGVQNSIQQISQYFLDQARMLGPVLWVESGTPAQVVLLEGVALEGYPTMVTLNGGVQ